MPQSALVYADIDVGAEYQTESYLITVENIKHFAQQYDPQFMHLDEQAALTGPFEMFTASGWQTLSVTMRLMALRKPFGQTPLVGVAVKAIRFHLPVVPGHLLFASAKVTGKRLSSKPNRGYITLDVDTFDRISDSCVLSQQWTVMVPA